MLLFLLSFFTIIPAIPRVLAGSFTTTSQHSSAPARPLANLSIVEVASNPIRLTTSIDSHTITATFSANGHSGRLDCFGTAADFDFASARPFFAASVRLPPNTTAHLSILSPRAFHVVLLQSDAVSAFTFEKPLSAADRIRPFINWRLFVILTASLLLAFAVRRKKEVKVKAD
jgi:hypothetical protein